MSNEGVELVEEELKELEEVRELDDPYLKLHKMEAIYEELKLKMINDKGKLLKEGKDTTAIDKYISEVNEQINYIKNIYHVEEE